MLNAHTGPTLRVRSRWHGPGHVCLRTAELEDDDSPADERAFSQAIKRFGNLLDANRGGRVLDLSRRGQGHDLAQVYVVPPVRTVEGLLPILRYP